MNHKIISDKIGERSGSGYVNIYYNGVLHEQVYGPTSRHRIIDGLRL